MTEQGTKSNVKLFAIDAVVAYRPRPKLGSSTIYSKSRIVPIRL